MAVRTWQQMRESIADSLLNRTGHDLGWWVARVEGEAGLSDEASLRTWLTGQGVAGYPQMLLVMERFGYPDFLLASADELIDGQYRDREHLRPILDATVAVAQGFGPVEVQARKTFTTLLTPRRTFSAVKPTTRSRVDLVLRLEGTAPGGRLLDARGAAGGGLNLRIPLASVDDLDDEAVDLLHRAYLASLP